MCMETEFASKNYGFATSTGGTVGVTLKRVTLCMVVSESLAAVRDEGSREARASGAEVFLFRGAEPCLAWVGEDW